MQRVRPSSLIRYCITALLVLALLPVSSSAVAQSDGTSYTSSMWGFSVEWTDDWVFEEAYEEDSAIFLTRGADFELGVFAFDGTELTPQEAVAPQPGETVLSDYSTEDVPWIIIEEDGYYIALEAYSINNGEMTLVISIVSTPEVFNEGLTFAQQEVTINGSPVLLGEPIADSATTGDGRGTSSASRTGRSADDTNQPDEPETEVTRTPRTGSGDQDAPPPTEEPAQTGDDDGLVTYTGPVYEYSVSYDSDLWTLGTEINEGNVDGIRLYGDASTYTIWAWDAYGSDPQACLNGEIDYYSSQLDAISDWQPALDADGQPLRFEGDDLAWGVFTLNYTDDGGNSWPLVDYISCEPIPGQDAVLIVLLSSDPEVYETEFDRALDVLDTLQFSDAQQTDTPEIDPVGDDEISISLDGATYTSSNYGFTAMIPLEWQILEETVDGGNERLVLGNGTSVVTLWATNEYSGDLAGCVDFAANSSGLNLALDSDASGGDFRGVYRNEAFGNFVYQQDGTQMMYFINCQAIPGTDGFLILIQDVEYDRFTAERRFRNEIQNSITMP